MEKHQKNIIEELKITADLARLEMHEDELKKAEGAFLEMIEYFSEMEAAEELLAEHSKAEAWDGGRGEAAWEHFRPDTARAAANAADGGSDISLPDAMLEKAGERDGRFIVIPNVL